MYSKQRAKDLAKKDVKYIPVGIHENVKLVSAKVDTSPKGGKFLEITFEKDGALLVHTEWKPQKGDFIKTDAELQTKVDNQFSRMLQILELFYTDEQLVFNETEFNGVIEEIAKYLNNADKTIPLRVKVVYNQKGYTTLPSYAAYTFIERMETPTKMSELRIDKFTRPVVADKEESVDQLASTTPVEDNLDGLPF